MAILFGLGVNGPERSIETPDLLMQKAFQFFGHVLLPALLLKHSQLLFQFSQAFAIAGGCDRQGRSHGCWEWFKSYQHPSASHSIADDVCAFDLLHRRILCSIACLVDDTTLETT